jgi:NAD-dependent DNA ligase
VAAATGFTLRKSVTNKLQVAVVSRQQHERIDKAREYGADVLTETQFWKLVGATEKRAAGL